MNHRPRAPRIIALLTAAGLGLGLLSACGSSSAAAAGPVTITFWDDNGGPDRTPIFAHLIDEFQTANPLIKVQYVGLPSASVQQKYDTAVAGGGTPDVGGVNTAFLSDLVAQNALSPLDTQMAASAVNGKIQSSVLAAVKSATSDPKSLYMVPSTTNIDTLWYRTDLIKTAPTTWDQFFRIAKAQTNTAAGKYGFALRGGGGAVAQLVSDIYAYSGITAFLDANGKSTLDDPKATEAVQKMAGLYKTATSSADVTNGYKEMVAEFDGGSTAMLQHNLGSYTNHLKALGAGKFDAVPLPTAVTGRRVMVNTGADGFSVFKSSAHQAEAFKFVEFLVSASADSYWNQKVGQIPTNTDTQKDAWVTANKPISNALRALGDPATTLITPLYYLPQWGSIQAVDMAPLWQKVILGQMSAADFTAKFASLVTAAQQQYASKGK